MQRKFAGSILFSSSGIEVAGIGIRTSEDFFIVTNAIVIDIGWTGSVAYAQRIVGADAIVHIIADAVIVSVRRASTIADAEDIVLAHAVIDVIADVVIVEVGRTASVAIPQSIVLSDTRVVIVADAVLIEILLAESSADAEGVEVLAGSIIIRSGRLEIARLGIGAPTNLIGITDTIVIGVVVHDRAGTIGFA